MAQLCNKERTKHEMDGSEIPERELDNRRQAN